MTERTVERDERTIVVENASYRWGYLLLSFGLLADVAYRGFQGQQGNWDLMALVLLGGVLTSVYQSLHRVRSPGWTLTGLMMLIVGFITLRVTVISRDPAVSAVIVLIAIVIGAAMVRFLRS